MGRSALARPSVADVATTVVARISVDELSPGARARQPDAVARANDRREIRDCDDHALATLGLANEREHVGVGVVYLKPVEALGIEVERPQGRLVTIGLLRSRTSD